jgi:hypothetical protein
MPLLNGSIWPSAATKKQRVRQSVTRTDQHSGRNIRSNDKPGSSDGREGEEPPLPSPSRCRAPAARASPPQWRAPSARKAGTSARPSDHTPTRWRPGLTQHVDQAQSSVSSQPPTVSAHVATRYTKVLQAGRVNNLCFASHLGGVGFPVQSAATPNGPNIDRMRRSDRSRRTDEDMG